MGCLETNIGHGRVNFSSSFGARVFFLALLNTGVLGSRFHCFAVNKLGGINLQLEVSSLEGLDSGQVFWSLKFTGGNLANKSSHALVFLKLKDADEKNIVNLFGFTLRSPGQGRSKKSTGLSDSKKAKST